MWFNDLLIIGGGAIWWIVLLLPWQPWRTTEKLDPVRDLTDPPDPTDLTVLIPARNEAITVAETLAGVAAQAHIGWKPAVILIDDQSDDATSEVAQTVPGLSLTVVKGTSPPKGWSGKLWALEQGLRLTKTPWLLLLDADIVLAPGMINALRAQQAKYNLALVSVMATLRMTHPWEQLLMPAFIFFFKLLYPFRLANHPASRIAAAAGGVVLVNRSVLSNIGGFTAIRDALIDDCVLARTIKRADHGTWIGLTYGAVSTRRYGSLGSVWEMVTRTAYTQLGHSIGLLLLCTCLMVLAFWAPLLGLVIAQSAAVFWLSLASTLTMLGVYLPILRYYRRPWPSALALPFIATLFIAMTWTSAINHWRGQGATWKGRNYQSTIGS